MSYADDLKRFEILVRGRSTGTVLGVAAAVHESITVGSARTGSPGQPVDTGTLINSWQNVPDLDGMGATIGTNVVYAPAIEDGIGPHGPLTLRSSVGGFHSVKLTVTNADALQADVVRALGGGH